MSKNVIKFRTAYDEPKKVQFNTVGETMTQQHLTEDADIRNIISRYDRTGILSSVARGVAKYGDYSEVNEFKEALDLVNNANESFMELPSNVREYFDNDPGLFFETATDPEKIDVMRQLGLAPPPPPADAPGEKKAKAKSEPAEKGGDEAE